MKIRRIASLFGLAVWAGLLPAALPAPDEADIPPAQVVPLPPPESVAAPTNPPLPPARMAPSPPVSEPAAQAESADLPAALDDRVIAPEDWPPWAATAWETTGDILHNRLRLGIRYSRMQLTDNHRSPQNSFLGSITELNALQDYKAQTWLTFDWLINPYIGARFTWEQIRAETGTTSTDNHTDGNVDLLGPALTFVLRYPNATRFTPTAGIGYAWLNSTFEATPIWHNGFGGNNKQALYDAWVAAGRPPWPNRGYQRTILLDDSTALILTGGVECRIVDHLDLHFFVQYMEVNEVGVTFNLSYYGNVFETTRAGFPMSNVSYGAGLRWTF